MTLRIVRALAILLLAVGSPGLVHAEGGDFGDTAFSTVTTERIAGTLTHGSLSCSRIDQAYRFDCYRQTFRRAAQQLNANAPYSDVRAILARVEKSAEQSVARHADPSKKKLRRGIQKFQATLPGEHAAAKKEFAAALDAALSELQSGATGSAKAHYLQIAKAIESNKSKL